MQPRRLAALSVIVLYAYAAPGPGLKDLKGRYVDPISEGVSVLVFTRTDCPISNRYAPELARIYRQTQMAGVRFWLVYVDPRLSTDSARAHSHQYAYPFDGVVDNQRKLVKASGVTITPEVAVYSAGRLIYRGRIDNRYVTPGTLRPAATIHDLEQVLSSVLKGESLPFRAIPAVGCFIEDVR